ncbi:MAG: hypothetical protein ACI8ZH_000815 [Flavobacteriales bacterium]|jgi:hypothetical protein|tara:strand:- start:167 stop:703 length:537 start_codon:yes stop_codon:yes gene_type:complete
MIKKILLIIGMVISTISFADDCLWGGSFLHSINKSDIIFIGKIVGYDVYSFVEKEDTSFYFPNVMIVEIEEIVKIRKSAFTVLDHMVVKRTVRVLSSRVNKFKVGSDWLFKMYKAGDNFFRIHLTLDTCLTSHLKIKDQTVYGNIYGKDQKLRSDGLEQQMKLNHLLDILREKSIFHE